MNIGKLAEASASEWFIWILSFAIVGYASYFPGTVLIKLVYNGLLEEAKSPEKADQNLKQWIEGLLGNDLAEFRAKTSGWIGVMERWVYIVSIMLGQFSLITGVLVLKAFFGWTDKTLTATAEAEHVKGMKRTIALYHTYLLGNLLSLALGILLGLIGLYVLPRFLAAFIPCAKLCAWPQ